MRKRLLVVCALFIACSRAQPPAPGTPFIIVSIDTLRADHLPAYGYKAVATPALDAFAADSIVFENAYSHCPLTLPSHVAMLTGELPGDNGVRNNIGFRLDPARTPTIPGLLKKSGYATGAAVSAYVLRGETGLRGAFDFYDDKLPFQSGASLADLQRSGSETIAAAEQWVNSRSADHLFFFLHLYEPHAPYAPPEPYRSRYASNLYDGEIATADDMLGRFFSFLRTRGIYDRAAIIVMSDHGEGLGDHGEQEHGIFLYREAIRVPLMLKLPSSHSRGTRVQAPVQLIDILPTVASLAGIAPPPSAHGASLIDVAAHPRVRSVFSETMYPRLQLGLSDLRSLIDDQLHFIDGPHPELYRKSDTAEKQNVISVERRAQAAFRKQIASFERPLQPLASIDPEEAGKLAALGYVGSTSASPAALQRDPKEFIGSIEAFKRAAASDLSHAIPALESVVRANPDFTDAWAELARSLERAGRYEEAASAYQRALALAPSLSEETALSLASVYLNLNRYDDARKHASLALSTNPGAAHLLLGRIALAEKKFDVAEEEARTSAADEHFRLQASILRAQALTKMNRMQDALAILDSVQKEIDEKHLRPLILLQYARGDALARMGRIEEAQKAFAQEIRLFPQDRQTYANLAALYYLQGRHADADKTIEQLVSNNRDRASYRLAYETYARLGDRQNAALWQERLKRLQ